jgi:deoxyribonuclease IV
MKLGVHTSIAGGLHQALLRGESLGCQVIQFFSHSPSQWKTRALTREEIDTFRDTVRRGSVEPLMIHTSYLINLGSPCAQMGKRSLDAFEQELERAEAMAVPYVVAHPGAHMGEGEAKGLGRIVRRLDRLHARTAGFRTRILLETTAGQGTSLGHRFEQLRFLFHRVRCPDRLGVCLDTCHLHAAGYDLRQGYQETMDHLNRTVGIGTVRAIHLNDSKTPLASRVDRHEHIGKGTIGRTGFRNLLADKRFRDIPMILETPKGTGDGTGEDRRNLRTVRSLAGAAGHGASHRKNGVEIAERR